MRPAEGSNVTVPIDQSRNTQTKKQRQTNCYRFKCHQRGFCCFSSVRTEGATKWAVREGTAAGKRNGGTESWLLRYYQNVFETRDLGA